MDRGCPGQDRSNWTPDDIFEVPCSSCGKPIEFFKDDGARTCGGCGYRVRNPRLDLGCASWCPHGERCLEGAGAQPTGDAALLRTRP
jgi:hypothetical protein